MKPGMSMSEIAINQVDADGSALREENAARNFVGGVYVNATGDHVIPVHNPATDELVVDLPVSTAADVDAAVAVAVEAQKAWAATPLAKRAAIMYDIRDALRKNADALADVIVLENGKTKVDALGEISRGLESIEYACGVATHMAGRHSRDIAAGIDIHTVREPIGVAGCLTPFNFPVMVPLWMIANAISVGNAVVLKPSEKAPTATSRLAEIMTAAGLPAGVFNVVHGDAEAATAIIKHPDVAALSFVGSTPIAKVVYEQGTKAGKRVQALGGAKNHMIVMPDADLEAAAAAAVGAAFGAAGERCMAISVVVAVGPVADDLIEEIKVEMAKLTVGAGDAQGSDFGPVITGEHLDRIVGYLDGSEPEGAKIVVDGREHPIFSEKGYFIGPSLIDGVTPDMECYKNEIFGPVLAIARVSDLDAGLRMVNENPFGNGAAIFTASGAAARRFETETNIGMLGINVPIPVPVGWYSFGGWKSSLFGDTHMYGDEGVRFFTRAKAITSRWGA